MLSHIERIRVRLQQTRVYLQRLFIFTRILIQLALNVKQSLVLGLQLQSLSHKKLQIHIVLIVNAKVHSRRHHVKIVGVARHSHLSRLQPRTLIVRMITSLNQIGKNRLAILLLPAMNVSLQIRNRIGIPARIHQIG